MITAGQPSVSLDPPVGADLGVGVTSSRAVRIGIAQVSMLDPGGHPAGEAQGSLGNGKKLEREGQARVPSGWRERDFRLGHWVMVQHANVRSGQLDQARRERLEALPGWTWDLRAAPWDDGFARLNCHEAWTGRWIRRAFS